MEVSGRAHKPEQKRAIIERLYAAWLAKPDLRLGQLIANATHQCTGQDDPFYIEDERLIEALEVY